MDVNYLYCDDHFRIYTNIESRGCTPKTSIMLHVSYMPIKIFLKKCLSYFCFSDMIKESCGSQPLSVTWDLANMQIVIL